MLVNEYIPKGGWLKARRNQKIKEALKVWAAAFLLVAAFAFVGYVERGM